MERRAYVMSLALHGVVLTLMLVNFNFAREYSKPPSVVLHIDLNKVQISNKTNLPQKTVPVKKKEPKPNPEPKDIPKEKPVAIQPKPKTPPKPQPQKPKPKPVPKPVEPVKNAVQVKEPVKSEPKVVSEKTESKIEQKPQEDDLQSLLATVEKVRQQPVKRSEVPQSDTSDTGSTGLEGRLDQMLTISEKDFISSKLRECWNINGGAQNLDEIIVEVKAFINKDGSIREVQILNKQNYPAFQSIAESAKRAIYICAAKGEDSPFYILSRKYADHYGDWKEIYLKFSPMEGVF